MNVKADRFGAVVETPRAVAEVFPDRAAWLRGRRAGIGSSDAPAILGLTPRWGGPYSVWSSKVHGVDRDLDSPRIRWGVRMEDPIKAWAAEDFGIVPLRTHRWSTFRHRAISFLTATPDGILAPRDDLGAGVLEIKTDQQDRRRWKNGPPLNYLVQLLFQMMVLGLRWGVIVVLVHGPELLPFFFERSLRFERVIVRRLGEFWSKYVEPRVAPPFDGSEATEEIVRSLFPTENGVTIELPAEADAWRREYHRLREEIEVREERRRELRSLLISALGANSFGTFPDGRRATFRMTEAGRRLYVPKP